MSEPTWTGAGHRAQPDQFAELLKIGREEQARVRRAALEEAARLVCYGCQVNGKPDGDVWQHRLENGKVMWCTAQFIWLSLHESGEGE